jgi:hypothetical protein
MQPSGAVLIAISLCFSCDTSKPPTEGDLAGAGASSTAGTGGVGGGPGCSQGTFSVGSKVSATGFDMWEGRVVVAALAKNDVMSSTQTVSGGRFEFDFLFPSTVCNLGASSDAGGALYVDVDDDGECDPAQDLLFVWATYGGPGGAYRTLALTPESQRCSLSYPGDDDALRAAQSVCPAVGGCFDFCGSAMQGIGGIGAICEDGADAGT